jgi:SAM-dependent methyltransferase
MNCLAYQISRLSFSSLQEFTEHYEKNQRSFVEIWRWGILQSENTVPPAGVCDHCDCQTQYSCDKQLWSRSCSCGLPNYERAVLRVLAEFHSPGDAIYHVGHFSRLKSWLSERYPDLHSSQYDVSRRPGEIVDGVRYESLTELTYRSESFDFLVCTEVLEHIPDYRLALREMVRVLKPGGRALLTFPWLGGKTYQNLTRANLRPDGTIDHILPPEYHGDPAKNEGILSFRSFGWQILDEMQECGFSQASAEFMFAPTHGYFTLLDPVIVGVR